ncbi:hypothetical protein [Marinifilum flexuosum]|uniref:hypothetical protein n=1 Tax=Marinifilum flexuosum TaxID=1117708 RepID=UPI0024941965|nr:hypothetical protein [Marinifilum flexuosum]
MNEIGQWLIQYSEWLISGIALGATNVIGLTIFSDKKEMRAVLKSLVSKQQETEIQTAKNQKDIEFIKSDVSEIKEDIKEHEKRVYKLENKV